MVKELDIQLKNIKGADENITYVVKVGQNTPSP